MKVTLGLIGGKLPLTQLAEHPPLFQQEGIMKRNAPQRTATNSNEQQTPGEKAGIAVAKSLKQVAKPLEFIACNLYDFGAALWSGKPLQRK